MMMQPIDELETVSLNSDGEECNPSHPLYTSSPSFTGQMTPNSLSSFNHLPKSSTPQHSSGSESEARQMVEQLSNMFQSNSAHDRLQSIESQMLEDLLFQIYDQWRGGPRQNNFDSDVFTESADGRMGRYESVSGENSQSPVSAVNQAELQNKGLLELRELLSQMQRDASHASGRLIRHLRQKDRLLARLKKQNDLITAILHAASQKRSPPPKLISATTNMPAEEMLFYVGEDARMKFTLSPMPGDECFTQWQDAMKAVARLPLGIPPDFRKKVWLNLADQHIRSLKIDWEGTVRFCFNERSNPDDHQLGMQIVKDLHRTGYSGFSGDECEEERALLKRVLLAYARWNKVVGYCQGFNVLAALILDVLDGREADALKVMIFLVDHVLPVGYFANNLRALTVDMAVFRELLRLHIPKLSSHLDRLQKDARDEQTGGVYEPPLTNVFTMHWFLTLFATCLPKETVLRVWDSILLDGAEILLRAGIIIWQQLSSRIRQVRSADEFYGKMGELTQQMLDNQTIESDLLIKKIYELGEMPLPHLTELREKYTYNITPLNTAAAVVAHQQQSRATKANNANAVFSSDEDDEDMGAVHCFGGLLQLKAAQGAITNDHLSSEDFEALSAGAYSASMASADLEALSPSLMARASTDLGALRKQYTKLRQRQKQAHVIIANASTRHRNKQKIYGITPPIEHADMINHLLVSRQGMNARRNRHVAAAPRIGERLPFKSESGDENSRSRHLNLCFPGAVPMTRSMRRMSAARSASVNSSQSVCSSALSSGCSCSSGSSSSSDDTLFSEPASPSPIESKLGTTAATAVFPSSSPPPETFPIELEGEFLVCDNCIQSIRLPARITSTRDALQPAHTRTKHFSFDTVPGYRVEEPNNNGRRRKPPFEVEPDVAASLPASPFPVDLLTKTRNLSGLRFSMQQPSHKPTMEARRQRYQALNKQQLDNLLHKQYMSEVRRTRAGQTQT